MVLVSKGLVKKFVDEYNEDYRPSICWLTTCNMIYKKLQLWKDKAGDTETTVQQPNDVAGRGTSANPPKFGCPFIQKKIT